MTQAKRTFDEDARRELIDRGDQHRQRRAAGRGDALLARRPAGYSDRLQNYDPRSVGRRSELRLDSAVETFPSSLTPHAILPSIGEKGACPARAQPKAPLPARRAGDPRWRLG